MGPSRLGGLDLFCATDLPPSTLVDVAPLARTRCNDPAAEDLRALLGLAPIPDPDFGFQLGASLDHSYFAQAPSLLAYPTTATCRPWSWSGTRWRA